MDIKSLSSWQVCWTQKLSQYHFRVDYFEGKANEAVDTLSKYSQHNAKKEVTL